MDNLVLIRVADALARQLRRAVLHEIREEWPHRFRLIFAGEQTRSSIIISLRPETPWAGRAMTRSEGPRRRPSSFTMLCRGTLEKGVLVELAKPSADRVLELEFAAGHFLIAELAPHGANLVLLDGKRCVLGAARNPRKERTRLERGRLLAPRSLPSRMLNPFESSAAQIDSYLAERMRAGESRSDAMMRGVFGLGREGARLLEDESAATDETVGKLMPERLAALARGDLDPVIECAEDPLEAAGRGELDLGKCRLLPWEPLGGAAAGQRLFSRDPATTAGIYYEALERQQALGERAADLLAILEREVRRLCRVERRVAADISSFEDPDRYRRWGEALLAGIGRERRIGDGIAVPDPYDSHGEEIIVPVKPGTRPQVAANDYFTRHRRAERGARQARERALYLAHKRERLEELSRQYESSSDMDSIRSLERRMRDEGLPVALEPQTRAGRQRRNRSRPRLEGVRLFTSSEGLTILVGKSGPHNHRLTFKLSSPDDFWLHAQGVPGAHVILRNPENRAQPPKRSLEEAAAFAAWYCEARGEKMVDVQWTRRKYVRRPRSAAAGTVVLKRFETIRIARHLPRILEISTGLD